MTYYERRDIPLQYELAETFTFLDAYHCSVFGSTNPNRNYLVSGTTGYEPGTALRAVTNAAYSYDHPGYDWTTYAERLEAAGVSWQVYQEWDNFTDNAIEYFKPFKRDRHEDAARRSTGTLPHHRGVLRQAVRQDRRPSSERLLAAARSRAARALTDAERSLFDRAMYRSRAGVAGAAPARRHRRRHASRR